MRLSVVESLDTVAAADWNALATDANPFLRHEFLVALERAGCVGPGTGWRPQHVLARDADGRLLGAVPLYKKSHSYGEYVFDWAWANAYAHAGLSYYPKLVAAVPFTPATGPRVLLRAGTEHERVASALIAATLDHGRHTGVSSLHWLFPAPPDTERLRGSGFLIRTGYQFHWNNPGYRDFEDFLSTFTSEKRKKIRRERRFVREAGITSSIIRGDAVADTDWERFHAFYLGTIRAHQAIPYLNHGFFSSLGRTLPDCTLLALAHRGRECVAAALFLRSNDALYGRYWGAHGSVHSLHFELCYYTPIEYCITRGLRRFEAGAQGEHKLARGFLPTPTYSAHWLSHPQFRHAVADYLQRESDGISECLDELADRSPYRETPAANALAGNGGNGHVPP